MSHITIARGGHQYQVEKPIEERFKAPESHPLFSRITDVKKITSPVELQCHPDTVFYARNPLYFHPNQMPSSGVRGDHFVAIRAIPADQYDMTHATVQCVYLRVANNKWEMLKNGSILSEDDFEKFVQLANGQEVTMNGTCWKRI